MCPKNVITQILQRLYCFTIPTLVEDSKSPTKKSNNRMPGNIVCGICGAVRYYAFILQAKKFGTFSCEPCRKFISKAIKLCKNTSEDDELFPCLSGTGLCLVPPVIRYVSNTQCHNRNQ